MTNDIPRIAEGLSEKDAVFLDQAARYFEKRPTQGEDSAHWSNVYNAENCRRIAAALRQHLMEGR